MAGKIMFRDIVYLTPDWSFRAQDGYIIFRWWRSYVPKVLKFHFYLTALLAFHKLTETVPCQ